MRLLIQLVLTAVLGFVALELGALALYGLNSKDDLLVFLGLILLIVDVLGTLNFAHRIWRQR